MDPADLTSGPLNQNIPPNAKELTEKGKNGPFFSTKGLGGGWTPYGGGPAMCPGRHFAKNEMIGGLAVVLTLFDIELDVPEGFKPRQELSFYGQGGLPIKDKVLFRIRRRAFDP